MLQVFLFVGLLGATTSGSLGVRDKFACQGTRLHLNCPRGYMLEILNANFGRTKEDRCISQNKPIKSICLSPSSKFIIERQCNKKRSCSIFADSSTLGGDACPNVEKYVDVFYKCVSVRNLKSTAESSQRTTIPTTKRSLSEKPQKRTKPTKKENTILSSTKSTTLVTEPKKTVDEPKPVMNGGDQGLFRSLLILLVLAKDKPKHSLLSVLIGVAAGTIIILAAVIICVCVEKKRQKSGKESFRDSDAQKSDVMELEMTDLLIGKKGRNSDTQSARTEDHVDSAFGDDEIDRRASNDYEAAEDMAYLDNYLKEFNVNKSLPRPPPPESTYRRSGTQKMSRRAHNDGSKGRNYDYNSNKDNSFTTFA